MALVLTIRDSAGPGRLRRFLTHPHALACAATSMILVGLGYHFLLREFWNPVGLQWFSDLLLHYVVPPGFCIYWFQMAPKFTLPWWSPLAWSLYPYFYFCYALLRGFFLGTYPYPFIDVTSIGFLSTACNAFALLILFVIFGGILLATGKAVDRARARKSGDAPKA